MRLAINGWRAHGQRTGVGRYLLNVVGRWDRSMVDARFDEITFYSHRPLDRAEIPLPDNLREEVLRPAARMVVWENLRLGPTATEDVLFCPSYSRPFVARGRTVVVIHDSTSQMHPELYGRSARLYNRLYGWSARHCTMVITSTEAARQDIARCWGTPLSRIRVVPLAAPESFRPSVQGPESDGVAARFFGAPLPYFLFVGKTSGRRRVSMLIESFAAFKKATGRPDKLLLVGPKPNADLQDVMDRLQVSADVRHTGFVSDEDLNLIYGGAQAVICPSVYETVSLPIIESQATGAPVICVDSAGSREITGGAALFMPELSLARMADAMSRMAADAGLRAQLREAGLDNSRQYSWDRTARETLDALVDAAGPPQRVGSGPP